MHRVELKVIKLNNLNNLIVVLVPNAPCGVESISEQGGSKSVWTVPNAPCGVEGFKRHQKAFSIQTVGGEERFKLLNTV